MNICRDIVYKRAGNVDLKMDIYLPPDLAPDAIAPAVLFIHKGYLSQDLPVQPKDWEIYRSYGELIASTGLVGVTFNYRYYGWNKADLETAFADVSDAVRFVRESAVSYRIDSRRLALWAFSGGGPLLSIPLRDKMEFVRCIISYYAILDLADTMKKWGVDTGETPLDEYSPLSYLSIDDFPTPAILICRAGMDNPALNEGVDRFIQRAFATGETIEVHNHPHGEHGFDILNDDLRTKEIIAKTLEFIKIHLNEDPGSGDKSLPPANKLYAILMSGNVEKAKKCYFEAFEKQKRERSLEMPYKAVIQESRLNSVGYSLLRGGRADTALELFQWAAQLYPTSPNVHDSLAEAYLAAGEADLALASAEKALKLLKKAGNLSESRKDAIRKSAQDKIGRLKIN